MKSRFFCYCSLFFLNTISPKSMHMGYVKHRINLRKPNKSYQKFKIHLMVNLLTTASLTLFYWYSFCPVLTFHLVFFFFRCVEPRSDSVHAGVWGASLPGSQRQRDSDHDHGLQIPGSWSHLQFMQRVGITASHFLLFCVM